MLGNIHFPEQLTGEELDVYLSKGWYRMGQLIFTTNSITANHIPYNVYWLRYNVSLYISCRKHDQIRFANRHFSVEIKPIQITDELENLFAAYKCVIDFEPAASVSHWLFDGGISTAFDTAIIEIRDNGILIAAGIFDQGKQSIAGILNFYHPEYKKYSLGKHLMLLKIDYCKARNIAWYYPGYIVYNYPKFDYKLFLGKQAAEFYVPVLNRWYHYDPALIDAIENAEASQY